VTTAGTCLAVAALVALAACSSGADAGPLDAVYDDGPGVRACLPRQPGQAATFGVLYIDPPDADTPVTLTRLSFAETSGVTLLGAAVGPPELDLVATGSGWPPRRVPGDVWEQTRPLEGATVTSREVAEIGLRLDSEQGSARTVVLDYEVDGDAHRVEIDHTYRLARNC
jgi:hypothetical protein